MTHKMSKGKYIVVELVHHLPFSTFGVMIALLMMGILTFIVDIVQAENILPRASADLFHIFHPSHILLSAVATTAMFMKHDGQIIKAICIGFFGSIVICTLSDAIFPYVGGFLIGGEMHLHIDILEHPRIAIPFALVGTLAGLAAPRSFEKATEYSHSMHVFVSSVASILYLLAFGLEHWTHAVGGVFLVTIFAVMIPCCLSDIAFPLVCTHKYCRHGDVMEEEHH